MHIRLYLDKYVVGTLTIMNWQKINYIHGPSVIDNEQGTQIVIYKLLTICRYTAANMLYCSISLSI